ncbi:HAD family hydrolase [Leptolyngbya sp. FACHB-17]|uniref:HAD family hydrolase n=1 Tax=unclassified Leptolyngbya TaxID=2650499 RepID=UPI001681B249|nr:HAD family hydrolase [Leptolyngbya sp. FACHB-17]MBD2078739.1 HAD family phosphatase [Leptolyngbya sp. FACHB-17]
MIPLSSAPGLQSIQLIATDMDGTLTISQKFTPQLLQAFDRLNQAGVAVLIVTGRSAGWVNGLVHYLPIVGAIAENGGLFYQGETQELLVPIADLKVHRQKLAAMFLELRSQFPQIQESSDNAFRLTDWTFDVAGLAVSDLNQLSLLCQKRGFGFTYSNVQCHIKLLQQDKAQGLLKVLSDQFPQYNLKQVATIGDSPNDESLFDASQFSMSIGVANIQHYQTQLKHLPTYITTQPEGMGFCEFADAVISVH